MVSRRGRDEFISLSVELLRGESVSFIGILQTADIDEAIECARSHVSKGEHILVGRHEYNITVGEVRESLEHSRPLEHEPIEYEVWVGL